MAKEKDKTPCTAQTNEYINHMNKQTYADTLSFLEWMKLCKDEVFVELFWLDEFDKCEQRREELADK